MLRTLREAESCKPSLHVGGSLKEALERRAEERRGGPSSPPLKAKGWRNFAPRLRAEKSMLLRGCCA